MFFKDTLNPQLKALLENKRVAVVGPAHYLTGRSQGHLIDEYDVVIRANQFMVPDKLYKDYGSRTDIMFHNCGTPWMPGLKQSTLKNPEEFESLKMVVCPIIKADHSETNFMSWPEDHISACAYNFRNLNDTIPFYWIGVKNYREIYKIIGAEPYTGIMTIATVLNYPIQELYVTGFDFYTGNKIYHDDCLSTIDAASEHENHGGPHGRKSNIAQMSFLWYLHQNVNTLTLDPYVQQIILKNT